MAAWEQHYNLFGKYDIRAYRIAGERHPKYEWATEALKFDESGKAYFDKYFIAMGKAYLVNNVLVLGKEYYNCEIEKPLGLDKLPRWNKSKYVIIHERANLTLLTKTGEMLYHPMSTKIRQKLEQDYEWVGAVLHWRT